MGYEEPEGWSNALPEPWTLPNRATPMLQPFIAPRCISPFLTYGTKN